MSLETDVQQPQWEDLVLRPEEKNTPKAAAPVSAPVPPVAVAPKASAPAAAPVAPAAAPVQPQRQDLPASYLTHELRAPVTAIRLGLEILQEQVEGRLHDDEKQMLSVAVRNTARLETLVNDIMDYSKIMAGKLSITKEPCDARGLLNEAADGLRAMAIAQGVKLVVDDGEPLPRISAEGRRVVQVLTNLLSNAIKFTPARGRVTVSAELGKHEHAGTIVFKVKDTGKGIPAGDIEKIFDMFIQSSGSNQKKAEGTGLGLTLARLMVELHGGRIWADSWRGVGATFYFTVPITAEDLGRKVKVYPKPLEYHGLLVSMTKRLNAFVALFV
jgi:signal transduction histidine kinase